MDKQITSIEKRNSSMFSDIEKEMDVIKEKSLPFLDRKKDMQDT